MADHTEFLELAREMISEEGRQVTFGKLDATPADANKPWKGPGEPTVTFPVTTMAVFLPDGTLGVMGGSGFGGLITDIALFKSFGQVLLVAPPITGEDLSQYHIVVDGDSFTDAPQWKIGAIKELKPADLTVLFAMGVSR